MQNGRSLRTWFRKLTNQDGEQSQAGATGAPETPPAPAAPAPAAPAPAAPAPAAPAAGPPAPPPPEPPPPPPMPGTEADAAEAVPGAAGDPAAAADAPVAVAEPDAAAEPAPDAVVLPDVAGLLHGVDVASFQGRPANWKHLAGPISWAAVKITELEPNGVHYVNPDAAADWAYLQ